MFLQKFEQYTSVADLLDRSHTPVAGKSTQSIRQKWQKLVPALAAFTAASHYAQGTGVTTWAFEYNRPIEAGSLFASLHLHHGKKWSFELVYEEQGAGGDTVNREFSRAGLDAAALRRHLKELSGFLQGRAAHFAEQGNGAIFAPLPA